MGKTVALLVAGGSGTRAGEGLPKQYRRIGPKTVIAHALDHLSHPLVDAVHLVTAEGHGVLLAEALEGHPLPALVVGGATRQQSVRNGLEAIADGYAEGEVDSVLIHDAARPFLPAGVIERLLDALGEAHGAVPVLPVNDTLAYGSKWLGDTAPREALLRVQTPQAFRFASILAAHRQWTGPEPATDDAQIARAAGYEIVCVAGDKSLEKLTYEQDFRQAEQIVAAAMTSRTGLGFDVHSFGPGDHVWLGGIRIEHDHGLVGHSDADVALHAITDALLGAAGEGDIGDHFPPSDPQWRGAASHRFLEHARDLILTRGGVIDHVDLTLICERPKIGPHKAAMRQRIAELLHLPVTSVSIKATTTERLGFTGRGEGMAAQAVATVRLGDLRC